MRAADTASFDDVTGDTALNDDTRSDPAPLFLTMRESITAIYVDTGRPPSSIIAMLQKKKDRALSTAFTGTIEEFLFCLTFPDGINAYKRSCYTAYDIARNQGLPYYI